MTVPAAFRIGAVTIASIPIRLCPASAPASGPIQTVRLSATRRDSTCRLGRQFGLFERPHLLLLCAAVLFFIVVTVRARRAPVDESAVSSASRAPRAGVVAAALHRCRDALLSGKATAGRRMPLGKCR